MRIASLIPAATEIAFALGLGDDVAGVETLAAMLRGRDPDPGLAMRLR